MSEEYYQNRLYPFQDEVLKMVERAQVDFYLTGATALSRCDLHHRYSDDLDFFVNDHPRFKEQSNKIVSLINQSQWDCTVSTASESFVRILLQHVDDPAVELKIDLVNDVPYRYGDTVNAKIFSRVDNWRNILSNKLCALSRMEAKDIADILFISKRYEFSWEELFPEAREKDLWVEPIEVCKIISTFDPKSFKTIKWVSSMGTSKLADLLEPLHDDIFYGRPNSLTK